MTALESLERLGLAPHQQPPVKLTRETALKARAQMVNQRNKIQDDIHAHLSGDRAYYSTNPTTPDDRATSRAWAEERDRIDNQIFALDHAFDLHFAAVLNEAARLVDKNDPTTTDVREITWTAIHRASGRINQMLAFENALEAVKAEITSDPITDKFYDRQALHWPYKDTKNPEIIIWEDNLKPRFNEQGEITIRDQIVKMLLAAAQRLPPEKTTE